MKRSWFAGPYVVWMILFTIAPLLFVAYYALTDTSGVFTLANFTKAFEGQYLSILWRSLYLAFFCTVICIVIGYPAAYFLASKDFSKSQTLLVLILLPMWMNFLLRTYAMMTILENNGLLNTMLEKLGFAKRQFIGTEGAVLLGMVYNFLPFMVLPVFTALKKLDQGVIEAAEDLGCHPVRVVLRVILPQSLPGVISGITMVFMPAVTTFAITRLLSNGMIYLAGDMIEEFFITLNNRPAGSALSLVMLVLILITSLLLRSINPAERKGGRA